MRVLLAGASGLIGGALGSHLKRLGHDVTLLVRPGTTPHPADRTAEWDPLAGRLDPAVVAEHQVVACFSGHNLMDGRWNQPVKQLIIDSRVKPTDLLARTIAALAQSDQDNAPGLFLAGSAVGYYGHIPFDRKLTENAPPGEGYLAGVCRQWEAAAAPAAAAGVRTVNMRTGFVLSMQGGALGQTVDAFRRGLGGVLGSGKQAISWICLPDLLDALMFTVDHAELSGPVNFVAPGAVDNKEFTHILAKELHKAAFLPIPAIAARAKFGEVADELMLSGQHVVPAKLQAAGFKFRHPDFAGALKVVLGDQAHS
jgi:uncharacterized protein (TIGR01777 family)